MAATSRELRSMVKHFKHTRPPKLPFLLLSPSVAIPLKEAITLNNNIPVRGQTGPDHGNSRSRYDFWRLPFCIPESKLKKAKF